MWPIATDVWLGRSFCLCVCDVMDRCSEKMAGLIEMILDACYYAGHVCRCKHNALIWSCLFVCSSGFFIVLMWLVEFSGAYTL